MKTFRPMIRIFILMFLVVLGSAVCSMNTYSAGKKIVLAKYPTLKIGFTTASLTRFIPVNVPNVERSIDFAADQGFSFIELRDNTATLTLSQCKEIATYAKQKNIEVIYALAIGVLDTNYWEAYSRAIPNAVAFGSPWYIRTNIGGVELNDVKTLGWTAEQFAKVIQNTNKAANYAKMFGLQMFIENGKETLQGDGKTLFGTSELFGDKGVNPNVGIQVDTGNFFCSSHVPAKPEDAKAFVEKNINKLGYIHLKTSRNQKAQSTLSDSDLPFDVFFSNMAKAGKLYVCIELDGGGVNTVDEAYNNFLKSNEYLQKNY